MSPSGNGGMELPPPVSEQLPPANLPEQGYEQNHEQQAVSPLETAPAVSSSAALGTPPPPPPLDLPTSFAQPSVGTIPTGSDAQSSLIADDGDLIEKEWVNKAKAIVMRTKEDPYKQSEELTMLKADYLQKRYSKTLKQST